jgi:hypothetical protein
MRRVLLAKAADEGSVVGASHLPGLLRIARTADGFVARPGLNEP